MKQITALLVIFFVSLAHAHTLTCNIDIHDKDGNIVEKLNIKEKVTEVIGESVLTLEKLYKTKSGRFEFFANVRVWENDSRPYQIQLDVYDVQKDVETSFHTNSDFLNGVQMDGRDHMWNRASAGYAFHCDFWATRYEGK